MLQHHEVAGYLVRHRLVHEESIVGADFSVLDSSRRNRNFKILQHRGRCYFIKQGIDPRARVTVEREAGIYRFLRSKQAGAPLGDDIPKVQLYDPESQILVLSLSPDAESMDAYVARTRRVPAPCGRALGAILANLHRISRASMDGSDAHVDFEDVQPHWIFQVHKPGLALLESASEASLALIRSIQRYPELGTGLDRCLHDWKADNLIHGDMRLANYVLLSPKGRRNGRAARDGRRLQIIDWELSCVGDGAWDIGCVFADLLALWVSSAPITRDDPIDWSLQMARVPLKRILPAIGAFWGAYSSKRNPGQAEPGPDLLIRSIHYAAARLLQCAYEKAQLSDGLTTDMICMVQLSLNLMRRPAEAAERLLGLTWPTAAP